MPPDSGGTVGQGAIRQKEGVGVGERNCLAMRKPNRPPTLPTASERETQARSYSYTLDGTVLSLTQAALKQLTIHRRDAVSASRRERRRMAAILRDDRLQARINKAIQRQLDKVERHAPPKKIRICVEPQNRRAFRRKERKIATSKSFFDLPSYDGPIIDRQGRQGIVMTLEYDGAKKHSFGIVGRRIVYISDPDHCELDILGRAIFISNMGGHLAEILMGADLVELAQRESRADAKLDVSIIIQLPHDVPQEVRVAIMKAVSHELFGRHSLPFAASLHRPDPNGDQRNYHCHIVGSWRPMTRTAPYSWEIAEDYRSDLDGAAYWRHARRRVAEIMTGTLERAGTERHYTHLSNAERGLPHKPQKKLDKRKTRTAREGDFVADVEANRRTMEANIALAKALETKREERRKRAFERSLAAIARVELARVSKLDLRPVTHVESGLSAPKLGPVMASQTTTAPARGAVESVRAPSRSAPAIAAPFGITVHLRKVAPTTPNWPTTKPVAPVFSPAHDLSEKVRPIAETKPRIQSDASIKPVAAIFPRVAPILRPVGPPVAKHTRIPIERVQPKVLSEGLAGVVQPVRKPAPATANVRPVGKPETADVTLRPVEVARVTHGVPRIEPVSGGSDRGVKRNPDASSAREKAPTIMADSAKSASDAPLQDELAREVQAARAFIDRVGNAAIHVGTDDDGMVLPMPVYWPENGLTRHGLSDPRVQAELVRMEQRQADYMKRIHPILRKTVTATLLAKGHSAIIEELPEAERAEARAWAATGIWTKLMRWVTEEGGRRSRRKLRCWRKARDLADGSQFVAAAKAEAQWKRWPVDLAPDDRRQLGEDARQHRARLAAQQTASRQAGIG